MSDTATLIACQIDVPEILTIADRDAHVDRVATALDAELTENGSADLAVLPELSTLHYSRACFDKLPSLAEKVEDSPSLKRLGTVSKKHGIAIQVGMARLGEAGKFHISQVFIGADGLPFDIYDKLHIAQFGESMEKEYYASGDRMSVVDINGFRYATIICYDMRSPDLSRNLVLRHGADVILHPTAFYRDETFHTWAAFATTRAVENQVFFASINRAGTGFGYSKLIPPWVDETVDVPELGIGEQFARFKINRSAIDHARANYSFLADVRDDYTTL